MKKFRMLVSVLSLCAVMLSGCTGKHPPASEVTSSAVSSAPVQADPVLSPEEQAKQTILEYIDVAYSGKTSSGASMYFMSGQEGEFVALVLVNPDENSYIRFVGSAEIDESSNILTVTDSETDNYFGFTAEKQADGLFFLDCGNLGSAYLQADTPEDVVGQMFTAFQTKEDVTDKLIDAIERLEFMESLDVAYIGETAAEAPMFFLASSDGSFAALVLVGASGESYISFVGTSSIDEESGILTVRDEETGYSFEFTAEPLADGSFYLDCGDFGECYLEPEEIATVINYIDLVYLELEDITETVANAVAE